MPQPLTEVARYQRLVAASLERVWENVLDWEHLPWVHNSSFAAVELEEARADGWRARIEVGKAGAEQVATIEICTEVEANRYVTRTVEGFSTGCAMTRGLG